MSAERRAVLALLAREADERFARAAAAAPDPARVRAYADGLTRLTAAAFWAQFRQASFPSADARMVALIRESQHRRARGEEPVIGSDPEALVPVTLHGPRHLQNLERRGSVRARRRALRRRALGTALAEAAEAADRQRERASDARLTQQVAQRTAERGPPEGETLPRP